MAKCVKCGRGGLFRKVNENGLCAECAAIEEAQKRVSELNAEFDRRKKEIQDQTLRLTTELENQQKMRDDVHQKLCGEAESELTSITTAIHSQRKKMEAEAEEIASAEKKLHTIENRISRLKHVFDSMQYAVEKYMQPDAQPFDVIKSFDIPDLDLIASPSLKCLEMKDLRAQYRQNERAIKEVQTAYEGRYTTKANSTIYKLMVLALGAELQNILGKLSFGKLESAQDEVKALTGRYYEIATTGNQSIAPTLARFIGQIENLYLNAVAIEYEYYIRRERAREEQRALKDQMRQEAEERKQLEAERKKVESEEKKFRQEMERITSQMETAHNAELEALKAQLAKVQAQLDAVADKKDEITALQNGKAGTVYIISNVGSFGEGVFKIGMTRRLEPQDRINELGDASVPFPFDVHSFIFSEDAVSLESELHKTFNSRRLNKINLRKEFFRVSAEELQSAVERIDPTAPFQLTALAEQFHQSEDMDDVDFLDESPDLDDEAEIS